MKMRKEEKTFPIIRKGCHLFAARNGTQVAKLSSDSRLPLFLWRWEKSEERERTLFYRITLTVVAVVADIFRAVRVELSWGKLRGTWLTVRMAGSPLDRLMYRLRNRLFSRTEVIEAIFCGKLEWLGNCYSISHRSLFSTAWQEAASR